MKPGEIKRGYSFPTWQRPVGPLFCLSILFLLSGSSQALETKGLRRHVPAAARALQPIGALPASTNLNLAISLPLRNPAQLTELLHQLYDPASPNYKSFLTPEEFAQRFGPTEADYRAVIDFVEKNGLKVRATHPNRTLLDIGGAVADIEKAFHVGLRVYVHPKEARTFFAPDLEPSLDLAVPVLHISGLDNFQVPRPMSLHARPLGHGTGVRPAEGAGPEGTFMGSDFRAAYLPGVTLTGAGQSVGLVEFDGYYPSDITAYEAQAGLPNVLIKNVLLDGFNGMPQYNANVEVALDIDMALCMAPGLTSILVYEGLIPNSVLNRMATDNLAKQLSASWLYGIDDGTEQIFQQFAAQGQSFFNASGDGDAWVDFIWSPADDPYITIVGGTTLSTTGPGGAWLSETTWNWGGGIGTGGGISPYYPIPSWQQGVSMTANHGSTTMRNLPDVALTADNIYVIADFGTSYSIGGTSAATPLWAGLIALVNQQALANGRPAAGFINPAVYALGLSANYGPTFHDIDTGDNTWSGSPSDFFAVPGYDLCTGWGTPKGTNLINALAPLDALQIIPANGFTANGGVGGPFSITAQNYTLTNVAAGAINWALGTTASWLTVAPTSGTLTPGGAAATVSVRLNAAASNSFVGVYGANVWFTNLNNGVRQSRQFTLNIIKPPVINTQPTNVALLGGANASFTVGATGGSPLSYRWRYNGANLNDGGNVSGSGTSVLSITSVGAANAGSYTVVITNAAGAVTSSVATLTITPSRPVITLQPASQIGLFGAPVRFTVAALGNAPLSYRWQQNGVNLNDGGNLSGVTTSTLNIASLNATNAGTYSVVINNSIGSTSSIGAVLTIYALEDAQLLQNGGFELGDFSFWTQFGNTTLSSVGKDGLYARSGNYGALLGPAGSLGYLAQTVPTTPGSNYLISLWLDSPDGLGPNQFNVVWNGNTLFDQTSLPAMGWTNLQFVVSATSSTTTFQVGFRDDATFLGLDDISIKRLLSPDGPPVVVSQPASRIVVAEGGTAAFSAGVAGRTPLSYQWQFNNANIANATSATLNLSSLTTNQSGNYRLVIGNAFGQAISSNSALTVVRGVIATIDFDDLPGSYGSIPDGYNDITWSNFYYLDALHAVSAQSGYRAGMVSSNDVAYNGYGSPAYLISSSPMSLLSAYLTAAWNDNLRVEAKGFANGVLMYDNSYTLSPTTPTLVNFNYLGVDTVQFISSGGTPHQGYNGLGSHFVMDNASVVAAPPLPSSTLYSFGGFDGGYPRAALVQGPDGNFYGTTEEGGTYGYGTVFRFGSNSTLTTLVIFNYSNGAHPLAGLARGSDGNLWGTTSGGGLGGDGTVFKLTTNGVFTSVASFFQTNGYYPAARLVLGADGSMYGTTADGGINGQGTVFKVAPNGVLTSLYSFNDPDGTYPYSGLVQGPDGTLYGTTPNGGLYDYGSVFKITTNGAYTTLLSFGYTNGSYAYGDLILATDGNLYGTTEYGGVNGAGTIFSITPAGTLNTIVSFGYSGGGYPYAGLVQANDGNFYGVTAYGGSFQRGRVFKLTPDTKLSTIYSFNGTNGFYPQTALIQGADGDFYGTTPYGGPGFNGSYDSGNGVVFRLGAPPASSPPVVNAQPASLPAPVGGAVTFSVTGSSSSPVSYFWRRNGAPISGATQSSYTLKNLQLSDSGSQFSCQLSNNLGSIVSANAGLSVFSGSGPIHTFTGADGGYSYANLLQAADGYFYGTTEYGGAYGYGTVFRLTTNGIASVLVNFDQDNGSYPEAGLIQATDGNLYGTTSSGGLNSGGTVFKVTTGGTLTTLASFNSSSGSSPRSTLLQAPDGNFYGTAAYGGATYDGTVFKVTPGGSLSTLASFRGTNGSTPQAGLVLGPDGNFYGTTSYGGSNYYGNIFRVSTNGTLTSLVTFDYYTNGAYPYSALVVGADGALYGTTSNGTTNYGGSVFRITTNGIFSLVAVFSYSAGSYPYAGLIRATDGNFYGTTEYGGTYGYGTVFRMTPAGALSSLYSFVSSNGVSPQASLIQATDGNLYGTTAYGGLGYNGSSDSGNGTVFRVTLSSASAAPVIISQPSSQTVPVGGTAGFNVSASGTPPLTYAWRRNGVRITGASSSSYTTNNVQLSDSGAQFTCIITNAFGAVTSSIATLTVVAQPSQLVQNGGFETGNFTSWTQSGNTNSTSVTGAYPHGGQYGAALGPVGSLGYLSQNIATVAGQSYLLSFWLINPSGGVPNEFLVAWNGTTLWDRANLAPFGWTNLQFVVTASGSTTPLQFGFRDDPGFFGLDDVSVIPVSSSFPLNSLKHFANGQFQFSLSGAVGLNYEIQVSTDLVTWSSLAVLTMTNTNSVFLDTTTSQARRFYRARLAP